MGMGSSLEVISGSVDRCLDIGSSHVLGVEGVEVGVSRNEVRVHSRCSGGDPEVVIAQRATVLARPRMELGIAFENLARLYVDDDQLPQSLFQGRTFLGAPVPLPRQGEAFADRNDRNQRTVCSMANVKQRINPVADLVPANHVEHDIRVQQQELARTAHDSASIAPAKSSSLSSPGQRPKIAFTPDLGPCGRRSSAVSTDLNRGIGIRDQTPLSSPAGWTSSASSLRTRPAGRNTAVPVIVTLQPNSSTSFVGVTPSATPLIDCPSGITSTNIRSLWRIRSSLPEMRTFWGCGVRFRSCSTT